MSLLLLLTTPAAGSSTNYSKTLTESLIPSETFLRKPAKALAESALSTSDALTRQAGRVVSETYLLTESFARQAAKLLADTVSPGEAFSKLYSGFRSFLDTLTPTDTVLRRPQKAASDSLAPEDAITKQAGLARSETFSLTDVLASLRTAYLTLLDTVSWTEQLARRTAKQLVGDAFTLFDALADIANRRTLALSDTIATADFLVRSLWRDLFETVTPSDTATKSTAKSPASESIAVNDAPVTRSTTKQVSESFSLTETIWRALTRTFSEPLSISDSLSILKAYVLFLADSLGLTDSLLRWTGKITSDTSMPSESITRSTAKSVNDGFSLTDLFSTARVMLLSLAETLGLTDLMARLTGKAVNDAAVPSDTVAKRSTKQISDTLGLTDALAKAMLLLVSVADSLGISDLVTRFTGRSLSDTAAPSDSLTRFLQRAYSETLSWSDALVNRAGKALHETYTLTDALTRAINRSLFDTVPMTDALGKALTFLLSLADQLGITEALVRFTNKAVGENLSVDDSLLRATARFLADSFDSFTDRLAKRVATAFSDAYEIVDEIDAGRVFAHVLAFVETFLLVDRMAPVVLHQMLRSLPSKVLRYFQSGNTTNDTMSERPKPDVRVAGGSVNDHLVTREKKPRRWF